MTKNVRIENADNAPYQVAVEVWDKGYDGKPDTLVDTIELLHPTALGQTYITSSRYLVVREIPKEAAKP